VKILLAVAASAAVANSAGASLHTSGASSRPSARGLPGSSVGSSAHTALLAWTTTPAIAGCFHRDGSGRSSGMSFGARCSSVFGRLIAIGKNIGIGGGAGDTSGAGLAVARRSHRRDVGVGHGLNMMVGSAEKQERQRIRAMVSFPQSPGDQEKIRPSLPGGPMRARSPSRSHYPVLPDDHDGVIHSFADSFAAFSPTARPFHAGSRV